MIYFTFVTMSVNINMNDYSNQIIKERNEAYFHAQQVAVMNIKDDLMMTSVTNPHPTIPADSVAKRKIKFSERMNDHETLEEIKRLRRHSQNYLAPFTTTPRKDILKPLPIRPRKKLSHPPITKTIIINKPLKNSTRVEQSTYTGSFSPVMPLRPVIPKPRYFCNEMISLKDNTIIKQAIIQTQIPLTSSNLSQLQPERRQKIIKDSYEGKPYHSLRQCEVSHDIFQEYITAVPNPELMLPKEHRTITTNLSMLADVTSHLTSTA